jgi:Bacterial protein of unknown function (DUF853).
MSSIKIGVDRNSKGIYQPENMEKTANKHCLYTGITGSGKTYGIKKHMCESWEAGMSVIAIDISGGLSEEKLEREFKDKLLHSLHRKIVRMEGLGIDIFKRQLVDSCHNIIEEPTTVADRVVEVLNRIFKLGCKQKAKLYRCIVKGISGNLTQLNEDNEYYCFLNILNNKPIMNFRLLQYLLKEMNDQTSDDMLDKLESMIDKQVFRGKELEWQEIVYGKPTVTIFDLGDYSMEVQKLIVEFILWDLWHFTVLNGSEEKLFVIILDECQNLNHKQNSPIAKILTEGRKFGWSCWLGTQFLQGQFQNDEIRRLQQAALQFCFKPANADIHYISKTFGGNAEINKIILQNLIKGTCLFHGDIATDTGRIIPNTTIKLHIPKIGE